jgi:hypothetical protein
LHLVGRIVTIDPGTELSVIAKTDIKRQGKDF